MGRTNRSITLGKTTLLTMLLLVSTLVSAAGETVAAGPPPFAPDRMLVKFKPGTVASDIGGLASQTGATLLRTIPGLGVHVLRVPAGTVTDNIAVYARNPNVEFAEPDFYRVLRIPTEGQDPQGSPNQYFHEQWALNNTGQEHIKPDPLLGAVLVTGAEDADIDAPEAWEITQGNTAVKIAILDTGVDCRTLSLPGGSVEFLPGKCIEEVNFVSDYSNNFDGTPITVVDVVAHGSHVAGIAAAATDNGIGIAGVGWKSSIGSLKACFEYYIDQFPPLEIWAVVGICPVSSSAAAMMYAADNGYHVINMSYASDQVDANGDPVGLGGFTQTESDAVDYAWGKGVVLVAAAGNGSNTVKSYPAAYEKVIAVGATDHNDNLASFSTFSTDTDDWVSILAPGDGIISTVPNALCVFYAEILGFVFDPDNDACLDWYSGTSMASPHVAGAAALVWSHLFPLGLAAPDTCVDDDGVACNQIVRQQLENGADVTGAIGQNMRAWSRHGRLNLVGALTEVVPPPSTPAAPSVTDNANGTATVTWDYDGQVELQREKLHAKRGVWQSLTSVWSGIDISYIDASGTGTFHYRVGAVLLDSSVLWSDWSGSVDVTGGSKGGGGNGGGGKGGGKPKK
jgi:thermitase